MNLNILNTEVQNFINSNLKTDLTKLILKGSPFNTIAIQEIAEQIVSKNKCETKLPTWFSTKNIYYPNKLNIEQTSSEITANYKANLVSGSSLIDLTGGFGIDTYYFSKKIKNSTHCEINNDLSEIVSHNYQQLKVSTIKTVQSDGLLFLQEHYKTYDWIYVDPSRRNDSKGKVFLLEDCIPNIPKNLQLLFKNASNILIKVSPILDITSAIHELEFVKEIHIVAVENEVKELLFVLEKNYVGKISIKTVNISKKKNQFFNYTFNETLTATYAEPQKYLYEPNSAILKSGGFTQVSSLLKIDKLHPHSHLYTSNEILDFPGRVFKIDYCITYDKKLLKTLIPSKKANITTRNFPETVEQIRKKTGIKDGGNQYLFFTKDLFDKLKIIICSKI
ncbi:class I SAM-dependent methyltransferase [Lutibacter sp.]|uniref:THUMP-like domain-containing protein n=1 Tax=Lutibacter sp. TaxID=1925666 RepID=UPI001A2C3F38|nr:class I SAM-dependent methyltransferase [Lutibacter sp.]MBI9042648.1 class I SAM-dependent methyltransferase [Lutibacter sp.]